MRSIRPGTRGHAEGVGDVEPAQQRQPGRRASRRRDQLEASPGPVDHDPSGRDVAPLVLAERHAAMAVRQPLPGGIVGVDDFEAGGREVAGELSLRLEVVLQRVMVVEVLARQVREDRRPEHQALHPPLVEAVRRDFHRGAARAARHQRRQRRLQVDRAGRRQIPGFARDRRAARVECAQRADRAHRLERRQHVACE